mmetsp:Transcript_7345/g.11157  ORF Transcript_7345/g.11157 Transcript_7345/m.11157 type:complete len:328 (+) Transcript_7345:55-1038(+)
MAIRRSEGFRRYAFSVQYHGGPFLGFTSVHDDKKVGGLFSVEYYIRRSLQKLVGEGNFENIQASSRTDRGVHALKNTCHVDIRPRPGRSPWQSKALHAGINSNISRQLTSKSLGDPANYVKILSVVDAPNRMENSHYGTTTMRQQAFIDWNARFSALERKYVYRILHRQTPYSIPFEWDRSWKMEMGVNLNVDAMREAAKYLVGSYDVSSFRGSKCERSTPVVTVTDLTIKSQPYAACSIFEQLSLDEKRTTQAMDSELVLISICGESFAYRQVRNMVGCLVYVGKEMISPLEVQVILEKKDRTKAPPSAPAHGLFLADVKHSGLVI